MNNFTAFTSSFLPQTTFNYNTIKKCSQPNLTSSTIFCTAQPMPSNSTKLSKSQDPLYIPMLVTRRTFVSACGALFGLSSVANMEKVLAATINIDTSISPLEVLQNARVQVNTIDDLINKARWDSIRTVLSKDPVNKTKDACNTLIKDSNMDTRGALVGLKEDALSSIQLLDTSVYSNVFIGEDRQILGTKIDYDVPRSYLAELKDALDALIDVASSI